MFLILSTKLKRIKLEQSNVELKAVHKAALNDGKKEHKDALKALKDEHTAAIKELKKELKDAHAAEVEDIKERHALELKRKTTIWFHLYAGVCMLACMLVFAFVSLFMFL